MAFKPVTFAVLPTQSYNDRFNPPAGQQLQATPMDANFAALNAELAKQPKVSSWAWRSYVQSAQTSFTPGVWVTFAPAVWGSLTLTVPECTALHVAIGASGYNNHDGLAYLMIGALISGPAVRVGGLTLRTRYGYDGGYWSTAKTWRIGTELTQGAELTLTPQYYTSSYSAGHVGTSRGMISVMAMM